MTTRKTVFINETIEADNFGQPCTPITRVTVAAILKNRYAGHFSQDLSLLFDIGGDLGAKLMTDAVKMLANTPVSFGKTALIGTDGDMEHGGALIHPKLGKPMRAAVGGGKAIIPSNAKIATIGTAIDIPLGHKDEPWSFDHFDTMTITNPDAPRADEIVLFMSVTDGPRPIPRVGSGPITD